MKPRTALLLAALLGALPLLPQQPSQDPGELKRRLSEIQSRMGQVDEQLNALKKRRRGVLVELQGISLQAERARVQSDEARLRRDQTEGEVRQITQQKEGIRQQIQGLRGGLRKQVRWMQALGPLGVMSFFPSIGSFDDYLVQGRYLAYWRNQQRRKLDLVQRLEADLAKREQELQAALQRLAKEEEAAVRLQADLKVNEDRLESFLSDLTLNESRQKEIQSDLAEEAIQLERMLASILAKPRPDAFESAIPFVKLAGELPQPVEGTLAQGFGEHVHPKFHTKTVQSGLLIATEPGAPVAAVADGRVVYADVYQSYGPMVILDHGDGYYSLYTHMRVFSVTKGQMLKTGEVLGSSGTTPEGPRVGFEIRHLTAPQDPNRWLKVKYR